MSLRYVARCLHGSVFSVLRDLLLHHLECLVNVSHTAVIKPRLSIILQWVVNTSLRDTQYRKAHHYALINVSFLSFKCTYISIHHTCRADCTRSTPVIDWLPSRRILWGKRSGQHVTAAAWPLDYGNTDPTFRHEIWTFSRLELAVRCWTNSHFPWIGYKHRAWN